MPTATVADADQILRQLLGASTAPPDPYPLYHGLRDLAPVHRSDLDGVWYVTGHEAARGLLLDPRIGKSPGGRIRRFGVSEEQAARFARRRRPSMITANPPDHTRLRFPARGPFLPRHLERLAPRIEEIIADRLDMIAARGDADVMADLALELPVTVIGELVGVPPADRRQFPELVFRFFAAGRPEATAEQVDAAEAAGDAMRTYFGTLIAERRARPRDDLLGHLVAVRDGVEALSEDELMGTITLIFVAGFITTSTLIGNGLLALARHPGEMDRLWTHPHLVPGAVEEMLRYDAPVQLVDRTVLADTEVDGRALPAGDGVVVLLGAANRDPQLFADPDRFDVARPNANQHLSFAWGLHHCLGAGLARLEATLVFAALIRRFARVEVLDLDPPRRPGVAFRTLVRLPVRVTPR